jgi:propanol-preferring alcohol dehydrogenase
MEFAVKGKVKARLTHRKLEQINEVFADLKSGKVDGRVVLDIGQA